MKEATYSVSIDNGTAIIVVTIDKDYTITLRSSDLGQEIPQNLAESVAVLIHNFLNSTKQSI